MEAKIQQPQLYVSYLSPANFAPGDRELDLLGNVLADGKSSRLYKRLVYDMKIAQAVTAAQQSQMLASNFEITASPMPGHTLDEILAVIDEEIAELQAQAASTRPSWSAPRTRSSRTPSAASRACWRAPSGCRATTTCSAIPASWPRTCGATAPSTPPPSSASRSSTCRRTRRVDRDRRSQPRRADHGAGRRNERAVASSRGVLALRLLALGCASAPPPAPRPRRAAGPPPRRPRRRRRPPPTAAAAAPAPARVTPDAPFRQLAPAAGARADVQAAQRSKRFKLKNGLEVMLVEFHDLPLVDFNLMIKTGGAANPPERAGLADLTAQHARRGDEDPQRARRSPTRSRRWARRCRPAAPGTRRTSACRR